MIDSILDYAVDHSAVFAALLITVVSTATLSAVWAYGRFHEHVTRRRDAGVIG